MSKYKKFLNNICLLLMLFVIGCEFKRATVNKYIGIAEKVKIIHTEDIDSSGNPINLYDIYINDSMMRIRSGCFAGQKVYRHQYKIYQEKSHHHSQDLIFCHGKAEFNKSND